MNHFDIVISIVHYNTPALLLTCLDFLAKEGSTLRVKIVVVDNASTPHLTKVDIGLHSEVDLIVNTKNVGFGSANNQAFQTYQADYYLVMNPDVCVTPGSFQVLVDRLKVSPKTGVLGVKFLYSNGSLQETCRRFPTLRSLLIRGFLSEEKASHFTSIQRYMMVEDFPHSPRIVDWVMGSCLFLRAEALQDVNGFDEKYFMYYEDIDLCHRLSKVGWNVEYYPEVSWIHHYHRQSARKGQIKLRIAHLVSALRFLRRRALADGWHKAF